MTQDSRRKPDYWIQVPAALSLAFVPWSRSLVTSCWCVLALVLLVRLLQGRASLRSPAAAGLFFLMAVRLVSVLGSIDVAATGYAWLGFAGVCVPLLALCARRDSRDMPGWLQAVWLIPTLGLGLWLLGELWSGRHILLGPLAVLGFPMLPNATDAGHYAAMIFAWCFGHALLARNRTCVAWTAGWVIAAILVAASSEKASALGFLAAAWVAGWALRTWRLPALATAIFGAASWLFPRTLWDRAAELGNPADASILYRLKGWNVALQMFAERPMTGEGFGAWRTAYGLMRPPTYPWPLQHPHSAYLQILAETGLLGLAGLAAALFGFRSGLARDKEGARRPATLAAQCVLAAALVGGLFDEMWAGDRAYPLFALLALAWVPRGSLTPGKEG